MKYKEFRRRCIIIAKSNKMWVDCLCCADRYIAKFSDGTTVIGNGISKCFVANWGGTGKNHTAYFSEEIFAWKH